MRDGPGDALLPLLDPLDEDEPLVEGLGVHEDAGGEAVLGGIHGLTGLVALGAQSLEVAPETGDELIARHDNSFHKIVWRFVGQRCLCPAHEQGHEKEQAAYENAEGPATSFRILQAANLMRHHLLRFNKMPNHIYRSTSSTL